MTQIYKVLNENGSAHHGGNGQWELPQNGEPGLWMLQIKNIEPCVRGYHLCRRRDLVQWLGPTIYEAEARGVSIECDDKLVVSEARLIRLLSGWSECTARIFACDCAERVVHFSEDERSRNAISVARSFANGKATSKELAAAWDATRAAAWDAAWDATWDATWDAAWDATRAAAWDATRAAAWDATRAAASAATRAAAWAAASAAASAATSAAARAAASAAARDATSAAARDATRAAARDAEYQWQTERLFSLLCEA